jgi:hypothetical protein
VGSTTPLRFDLQSKTEQTACGTSKLMCDKAGEMMSERQGSCVAIHGLASASTALAESGRAAIEL